MGEQSQQQRRTRSTGESEPLNLPTSQRTGRIGSVTRTEGYAVDEGMTDRPRPPSSVVPYLQRTTGSQSPPMTTTVPRRQKTKNLPPRQTRTSDLPPRPK